MIALKVKWGERGKAFSAQLSAYLHFFLVLIIFLALHRPAPCCRTDSSELPELRAAAEPHSHLPGNISFPLMFLSPPSWFAFVFSAGFVGSLRGCSCSCLFLEVVLRKGEQEGLIIFLFPQHAFPFPCLLLMFKLEI